MANVIHRGTLQYRRSVNTPDFPPTEWIVNPDLSQVEKVPRKYWRIDGERVVEMSENQKAAVDGAELEQLKADKLEELQNEVLSRLARSDVDYLAAAKAIEAAKTPAEVDAVSLAAEQQKMQGGK